MNVDLSAWLDGELDEAKAKKVEAEVAADPALRAEVEEHRAGAAALRRMVDDAEARVDFSSFSAKVMAAIDEEASAPAQAAPSPGVAADSRSAPASEPGIWERVRGGFTDFFAAHRPALAAAATVLVILGGGSFYFLLSHDSGLDMQSPVELRGGSTVIEDLTFGDASAVVFRTDADVTVIWVSED